MITKNKMERPHYNWLKIVLAEKYEFSGGQIENIARHNAINGILYGDKGNTLETLMTYCDSERLETKQTRKIGF